MPRMLRTFLHLVLIGAVVIMPGVWLLPQQVNSTVWAYRLAVPVLAMIIVWVLLKQTRVNETLYDHLHDIAGHYFERSGLCFRVETQSIDGICYVVVYYQGRYSGTARAQILLIPRSISGPNPFPVLNVDLICSGADFGVVRVPLPIAESDQGWQVNCEVYADVTYRNGRGRKVRHREGIPVKGFVPFKRFPLPLRWGYLFSGHGTFHESLPACTILKLPVFVATVLPGSAVKSQEVLFHQDLSTGGFPVLKPA